MFNTFITFMVLTTALIFTQINHPLAMGLTLLIQTLLVCLISGLTTQTFWFSYMLFLVFLGGLLVLFIYVTSLASNEMFSLTPSTSFMFISLLATSFLLYLATDPVWLTPLMKNLDMMPTLPGMPAEEIPPLMKLYNQPTNLITLMLALYLFITLIAVVHITKISFGPLRQGN
uniref:NADH-ubiquinone oxidoreductase chain 6 n=1 Tax=Neoperla sp. FS-2017 TaxID=2021305 RepID=A0A678RFM5_9NEOP|nr:NADH dehydrogenase subunit 6 [Neoperla sp. FS-2017]